jgi:hypothetical protein
LNVIFVLFFLLLITILSDSLRISPNTMQAGIFKSVFII